MRWVSSARSVLIAGCLLLIVLPLLFLGLAWAYEAGLLRSIRGDLQRAAVAAGVVGHDGAALDRLARRARARAYLLGPDGRERARAEGAGQALDASMIGTLAERVLGGVWAAPEEEDLDEIERRLGGFGTRDEVLQAGRGQVGYGVRLVPGGRAVVIHVAAPQPGGEVLYLCRGSRRGLRQLLLLRHQLLKLILYQCGFALLLGGYFSRRLVTPLERLAQAARRYPGGGTAGEAGAPTGAAGASTGAAGASTGAAGLWDPELLARRDELGELARAIQGLAEDLEARRRATADLGADVAHEFKNPLATIAASVELLQAGATPERVALVAEHVNGAVVRLRRSLDALMSLLRLEAGLRGEAREWVDYGELLGEIVADYRSDPRWAGFVLRVECAPGVGRVRLVSQRWEELVRNLLDNALVQPAERREVVVQAQREGALVVTTVRDHGPGVAEGNRDKIFRRFFTQRPAGVEAGTGLGLSIVQAVAEAHGGRVELRQPADGPGAEFVVTLLG